MVYSQAELQQGDLTSRLQAELQQGDLTGRLQAELQQYRFDFTEEFGQVLSAFAAQHKNAARKTFKSEWNLWCEMPDIKEQISLEITNMKRNGFEGDILDKMFKSARYYHRKNVTRPKPIKCKTEPKRHSNRFTKGLLDIMDTHIEYYISTQINKSKMRADTRISLSQSEGYNLFCETRQDDIYAELLDIKGHRGIMDAQIMSDKLKKAYKTRFYTKRKNSLYNFAE